MKVTYDQEVDILRIILNDADIDDSDEDKPGIIIDYDGRGNIVGMEILDASRRIDDPGTIEYIVTCWGEPTWKRSKYGHSMVQRLYSWSRPARWSLSSCLRMP